MIKCGWGQVEGVWKRWVGSSRRCVEKVGWVRWKMCEKGGLGRVEGVWKMWVGSSGRCVEKMGWVE